jgi:hypothetical protein
VDVNDRSMLESTPSLSPLDSMNDVSNGNLVVKRVMVDLGDEVPDGT